MSSVTSCAVTGAAVEDNAEVMNVAFTVEGVELLAMVLKNVLGSDSLADLITKDKDAATAGVETQQKAEDVLRTILAKLPDIVESPTTKDKATSDTLNNLVTPKASAAKKTKKTVPKKRSAGTKGILLSDNAESEDTTVDADEAPKKKARNSPAKQQDGEHADDDFAIDGEAAGGLLANGAPKKKPRMSSTKNAQKTVGTDVDTNTIAHVKDVVLVDGATKKKPRKSTVKNAPKKKLTAGGTTKKPETSTKSDDQDKGAGEEDVLMSNIGLATET